MHHIITKAALLERLTRGPATVQAVYVVTRYRVSAPDGDDPNEGVWISLSPDHRHIIEDYATAHAYVAGRELRLTHHEADEIARLITRMMKRRPTLLRASTRSRGSVRRGAGGHQP